MKLLPVVLSGGSGTRLWPLSRETYPKQLLPLVGEQSMLQATVARLKGIHTELLPPLIVCNEEYRFITAEQLRQSRQPAQQIILEPAGRNTAPALTLAALSAVTQDDPAMLVMPADHVITDEAAFRKTIESALPIVADGGIVTFGIVPTRPETGYGYIKSVEAGQQGAQLVERFVEKPDLKTAESYLASGAYSWNSGIFMMRASVWLAAIKVTRPDIADACEKAHAQGQKDADFYRVDKATFLACPSDSIDYAVLEKITQTDGPDIDLFVVPMIAGWSDVGAWDALWDVAPKDEKGNAARGDTLLHDTRDSLVYSTSRLVATVGLTNIVVVETPDAVMVADKSRTQDVKKLVEALKGSGRGEGKLHRKVYRPWGYYDSIDNGERFQVKRIVVNPGACLSLQMHHHRAEHWIVVTGTAQVTCGEKVQLLSENQSTYIPLGEKHRLENPGKVPLELIEVQSGSYLGEDDIVRFQDTYGRN